MKNTLSIAVTEAGAETQITGAAEFKITLNPEAEEAKKTALDNAVFIAGVTNPAEQLECTNATAVLKGFARDIEKSRKEIKRPFLDAGDAIDAAAKEAVKEVNAEVLRLESYLSDYQRKEEAKAAAIRAEQERIAAEIENRRREAEAAEARRLAALAAEAEAARQAAETARLAAEVAARAATTRKAREAAESARIAAAAQQAESDRLANEQAAREMEAQFKEAPAPVFVPPVVAPKVDGGRVNSNFEIEVLPGGLELLYKHYGTRFVKLTLDKAALTDFLKWPSTDPDNIPGIKATREIKVSVKAATANQLK